MLVELVTPVDELVMDGAGRRFGCISNHAQCSGYAFHYLLGCLFGSVKIYGEMIQADCDEPVHDHLQSGPLFRDEEYFFAVGCQRRDEIGNRLAFAGAGGSMYDRILSCADPENRALLA
jgi:hypothetical protein